MKTRRRTPLKQAWARNYLAWFDLYLRYPSRASREVCRWELEAAVPLARERMPRDDITIPR